jgi:16S rRNA (guanine527-N7)-methyltransferase
MNRLKTVFPELPPALWPRLEAMAAAHREWNAKVNLVSRKDIENLEWHHYAPCLAASRFFAPAAGARVLDVGTGGGFPGLLLALLFPKTEFVLADSVGKKIAVVADISIRLKLSNVRPLNSRAETLHRDFDFVTGRAVASLPLFFQWARRCLRTGRGGTPANGVIYWQGGPPAETKAQTGVAPATLLSLETTLADPRFAEKYIAHYPTTTLVHAKKPQSSTPTDATLTRGLS